MKVDLKGTKVELQAADRIIVKVPVPLSGPMRAKIHRMVERWAGSGVEVLILEPGMELFVERPNTTIHQVG